MTPEQSETYVKILGLVPHSPERKSEEAILRASLKTTIREELETANGEKPSRDDVAAGVEARMQAMFGADLTPEQ